MILNLQINMARTNKDRETTKRRKKKEAMQEKRARLTNESTVSSIVIIYLEKKHISLKTQFQVVMEV